MRKVSLDAKPARAVAGYAMWVVSALVLMHGACLAAEPAPADSQDADAEQPAYETWNAKFQATYIWQDKSKFSARYSSTNSLVPSRELSYSFTGTAFLGLRPWQGGGLYLNPEVAEGKPLSGLQGFGGFTNGEMARSSGPTLKLYRARLFLRQTWGMGGGQEKVESDQNQLAGSVDKRRFVLTAGNLAVTDIFDANSYSHDPRTQFMNWSIMTQGAYDFAADARGYTWGLAGEWFYDDWVVRAGRFIEPVEPNAQPLDLRIFKHYGDQIELEHAHTRLASQARCVCWPSTATRCCPAIRTR